MVLNKNVIWSPAAKADIENISKYIMQEWGKKVLSRFLLKVDRIINQIVINPKQYSEINTMSERKYVLYDETIVIRRN